MQYQKPLNKIDNLGEALDYDNPVSLSSKSKQELLWWVNNFKDNNGKRIRPQSVNFTMRSDSSRQGSGVVMKLILKKNSMEDGMNQNLSSTLIIQNC